MFRKLREKRVTKYLRFIEIVARQLGRNLSYEKKMKLYNIAIKDIKNKKRKGL